MADPWMQWHSRGPLWCWQKHCPLARHGADHRSMTKIHYTLPCHNEKLMRCLPSNYVNPSDPNDMSKPPWSTTRSHSGPITGIPQGTSVEIWEENDTTLTMTRHESNESKARDGLKFWLPMEIQMRMVIRCQSQYHDRNNCVSHR